jgi:hybrid cluster-associated redox disulfide protein
MAKTKKITGKMTIAEVLRDFPEASGILMGYGHQCAGCPAAESETIEELAQANQLNLKILLDALNSKQ